MYPSPASRSQEPITFQSDVLCHPPRTANFLLVPVYKCCIYLMQTNTKTYYLLKFKAIWAQSNSLNLTLVQVIVQLRRRRGTAWRKEHWKGNANLTVKLAEKCMHFTWYCYYQLLSTYVFSSCLKQSNHLPFHSQVEFPLSTYSIQVVEMRVCLFFIADLKCKIR